MKFSKRPFAHFADAPWGATGVDDPGFRHEFLQLLRGLSPGE
jgi:hypothetical protein